MAVIRKETGRFPSGQSTIQTAVPKKFKKANRNQVLPARGHELVHADPRQRRADPHHYDDPPVGLEEERQELQQVLQHDVVGDVWHRPATEEERRHDGTDDVEVAPLDEEEE